MKKPVTSFPTRKPTRLSPDRYLGKNAYFVTLCTQARKKVFDSPALVETLRYRLLEKCEEGHFTLYAYCFMPDHLHLELLGTTEAASLQATIAWKKMNSPMIIFVPRWKQPERV